MAARRVGVLVALVIAVLAIVWWQRRAHTARDASRTTPTSPSRHPGSRAQQGSGGRRVAGTGLLDGAPVAGATVYVVGLLAHAEVQSDAHGGFEVRDVRGIEVVVAAEKAGLTGSQELVQLTDPGDDAEHVTLELQACSAS